MRLQSCYESLLLARMARLQTPLPPPPAAAVLPAQTLAGKLPLRVLLWSGLEASNNSRRNSNNRRSKEASKSCSQRRNNATHVPWRCCWTSQTARCVALAL